MSAFEIPTDSVKAVHPESATRGKHTSALRDDGDARGGEYMLNFQMYCHESFRHAYEGYRGCRNVISFVRGADVYSELVAHLSFMNYRLRAFFFSYFLCRTS